MCPLGIGGTRRAIRRSIGETQHPVMMRTDYANSALLGNPGTEKNLRAMTPRGRGNGAK